MSSVKEIFRVQFWACMSWVRRPCRTRIGSSFPGSESNHSLNGVEQERQCKNNVIMWNVRVTTLALEAQQCDVFFNLPHKRHDRRGKKLQNIKCVLSLQLLSATVLILRGISVRY
jgi:hypothetical protein